MRKYAYIWCSSKNNEINFVYCYKKKSFWWHPQEYIACFEVHYVLLLKRILKYIHHPFQVDGELLLRPQSRLELLCVDCLHYCMIWAHKNKSRRSAMIREAAESTHRTPTSWRPAIVLINDGRERRNGLSRWVVSAIFHSYLSFVLPPLNLY